MHASETWTRVYLDEHQWARLCDLVRYVREAGSGGWQNRITLWTGRMDHVHRSIVLSHQCQGSQRLSDIESIRAQIRNRHGGGFQSHIASIFAGTYDGFDDHNDHVNHDAHQPMHGYDDNS